MKFTSTFFAAALAATVAALPLQRRDVDPSLIPQFGFQSGVNPTGTGNCDGAVTGSNGKPVQIPCACPPDRNTFIQDLNANVAAGHAVNNPSVGVTFPSDSSVASQITRLQAAIVTLQNLNGSGKGCPAASTTFSKQLAALQNPGAAQAAAPAPAPAAPAPAPAAPPAAPPASSPASAPPAAQCPAAAPPVTITVTAAAAATSAPAIAAAPAPPAPAAPASSPPAAASSAPAASSSSITTPAGQTLTLAQIDQLTPQFGHAANVNPTGSGDCDGAVNDASGKPVKVPCDCPPARDQFIQLLAADIAAGHATNNPSVQLSFPTDNSANSQHARFNAASVALQNLHGPGQGCPIASTTFSAQNKAIQG